jgi:hypothetical protein
VELWDRSAAASIAAAVQNRSLKATCLVEVAEDLAFLGDLPAALRAAAAIPVPEERARAYLTIALP